MNVRPRQPDALQPSHRKPPARLPGTRLPRSRSHQPALSLRPGTGQRAIRPGPRRAAAPAGLPDPLAERARGPRTAHQHRPGGLRQAPDRLSRDPGAAPGLPGAVQRPTHLPAPQRAGNHRSGAGGPRHSRRRLPLPAGSDAVPGPRILHAVRRNRPGVPQQALRGGGHPLPP